MLISSFARKGIQPVEFQASLVGSNNLVGRVQRSFLFVVGSGWIFIAIPNHEVHQSNMNISNAVSRRARFFQKLTGEEGSLILFYILKLLRHTLRLGQLWKNSVRGHGFLRIRDMK